MQVLSFRYDLLHTRLALPEKQYESILVSSIDNLGKACVPHLSTIIGNFLHQIPEIAFLAAQTSSLEFCIDLHSNHLLINRLSLCICIQTPFEFRYLGSMQQEHFSMLLIC